VKENLKGKEHNQATGVEMSDVRRARLDRLAAPLEREYREASHEVTRGIDRDDGSSSRSR